MGNWVVLSAWNVGDGFHSWHVRGHGSPSESRWGASNETPWTAKEILDFQCIPVIEQHQSYLESLVPEIEIEVRYLTGLAAEDPKRGWHYTIRWLDRHGQQCYDRAYGKQTEQGAKEAAEYRCKQIATAMLPATRYKFTPEL